MREFHIEAERAVLFWFPGMPDDERERANVKMTVFYSYTPGRPAFTPRGEYAPIDPPEPPEVELIRAELIDGDGLDPTPQQVQDWAQDWLDDNGFNAACDEAERQSRPDPDDARDAAIENAEFFRDLPRDEGDY